MTKKVITFSDNSTHTVHYENSDDNTVVKFDVPDTENANKKQTVTSHSKTDSFGRKVFDELQLGTDFVSRQFVYHAGKVTAEHKEKAQIFTVYTSGVQYIPLKGDFSEALYLPMITMVANMEDMIYLLIIVLIMHKKF